MVTLEEYKNHLVNVYRYEIDNNDNKKYDRLNELNKKYGDDYLSKIINDTYSFIKIILETKDEECNYCKFYLDDDTTCYISLNLVGGGFSDTLFIDIDDRIISKYILNKIFGSKLSIEVRSDIYDLETDDENIGSFYLVIYLYLQNFPSDMSKINEMLFGNEKTKKR